MTHEELREADLAIAPLEEVTGRVLGRPAKLCAILREIDAAVDARVARITAHTSEPRDLDAQYHGNLVGVCRTAADLLASEIAEIAAQHGGVGDSEPASLSPVTWERVRMGMTVIQQDRRQALYGVAISPALADIRSR